MIAALLLVASLIAQTPAATLENILLKAEPYALAEPSRRELKEIDKDLARRVREREALEKRGEALRRGRGSPEEIARFHDLARKTDAANAEALRTYAETYGWFPRSVWDWWPGWNAWRILRRAPYEEGFQGRVLATMKPLVEAGEIGLKPYAYLYDQVAAEEGLPQRWATQGACTDRGVWEPFEVEDPSAVDALRNEAGIEPLEDFARYKSEGCGDGES